MKTRIYILMLALVCLIVMSVYAAQEGSKEEVAGVKSTGEAAPEKAVVTEPVAGVATEKAISLETEQHKVSYIIGTQIAVNLKKAKIDVNLESLIQGIKDALVGKRLALSQDEMKKVYSRWQRRMQANANLAAGNAFLEANKVKEGVKVLPSGLQYKVITQGTGNTPTASDRVKTHYRGTLIEGKEFDSSYKRGKPAEFAVTGVIKGWTEALQLMKEGGKWELYIPANLAYGERARPGIPPNSTLIFEIELLEVVGVAPTVSADDVYYSDATDPDLGSAKNIVVEQTLEGMRVSASGISVQALITTNSFKIKVEPEGTEIEQTIRGLELDSKTGCIIAKANIKLGKDSTLPAKLPVRGGTVFAPKLYGFIPGASGSQNVSVKINKAVGYTEVAGLRFKQEVILNIRYWTEKRGQITHRGCRQQTRVERWDRFPV